MPIATAKERGGRTGSTSSSVEVAVRRRGLWDLPPARRRGDRFGGRTVAARPGGQMAVKERTGSDLVELAKQIRADIVRSTTAAGSGHPSSSLSMVEILSVLYFGGVLRYDPENPKDPD